MAGRLNNLNMFWLAPPPSRQGSRHSSNSNSSSQRTPVRSSCGSCRTPSSRSRSRKRSRSAAPSPPNTVNNINARIRALLAFLERPMPNQNRNAIRRILYNLVTQRQRRRRQ